VLSIRSYVQATTHHWTMITVANKSARAGWACFR
jgi:hypothetical protein